VVTAAARLFAENGYGATIISDIARAAGVAVGGKPALIGAVVSRAIADLMLLASRVT
jgi:AcrR family transcriptional regulator